MPQTIIEYLKQPMAEGGMWLQPGGDAIPPIYVIHEAHIQRLRFEGWQPVADPRIERIAELEARDQKNSAAEPEQQEPVDVVEPGEAKPKTRRNKPE